jgi:hypothetical protein
MRATAADIAGRGFRKRRFAWLLPLLDHVLATKGTCRVIDIGGEPDYWTNLQGMLTERRVEVTLLNLALSRISDARFTSVLGDARDLRQYADMSFDLVHSNSVIEHVGRWGDMLAMAGEVRRLAPVYFVQTPYFWFPIEPHNSTLFFHWLPESVRLSMLLRKSRGHWGRAPDVDSAMRQLQSAVLLDRRMLAALFPDALIKRERILGVTKSLVAVRGYL